MIYLCAVSTSSGISSLLVQVCKQRRNKSNALLAEAGVHGGQDILLYHLSVQDGQSISELAGKMCIQFATISNMVSRMETRELIRRERDGTDQRVSRLFITEAGRQAYAKVAAIWNRMETRLTRGLSKEEREMLATLLRKVLRNL